MSIAGGLDEMFKDMKSVLEAKAKMFEQHRSTVTSARQEIMKYDFNQLFAKPNKFASPDEKNALVQAKLEEAVLKLPTVMEMFPHLWDQHQGYADVNRKVGGRKTEGVVPGAWNKYINDYGVIDNEKACIELLRVVEDYNGQWQKTFVLSEVDFQAENPEQIKAEQLSKKIDAAIASIDEDMGYDTFAKAVAKVMKEEYGTHVFDKFSKALIDALYD